MFTDMRQGTQEHWKVIGAGHRVHQQTTAPMQIMDTLRRLEPMELGFAANQLTHSLMAGTLEKASAAGVIEVSRVGISDCRAAIDPLLPATGHLVSPHCDLGAGHLIREQEFPTQRADLRGNIGERVETPAGAVWLIVGLGVGVTERSDGG